MGIGSYIERFEKNVTTPMFSADGIYFPNVYNKRKVNIKKDAVL